MNDNIIPQSFEEWHHCITEKCAIELTTSYINNRISSLEDTSALRTQQFMKLYGQEHYKNVLIWFKRAKSDLQT